MQQRLEEQRQGRFCALVAQLLSVCTSVGHSGWRSAFVWLRTVAIRIRVIELCLMTCLVNFMTTVRVRVVIFM